MASLLFSAPAFAKKYDHDSGDFTPESFAEFEAAYKTLGDKLRPQVYELGFLR